ncbi:copper resistance CopC family protein [uncultured Roseobacter sp.]|uniref:copper resistance CopC family protein n=1 Tax=uncultured Roseobacter sp. TaxID=114847 RepID=UPI002627F8F5|nr:copper resistance CopC family protein [uncultured Roseobacter sp.]
MFKQTLLGLAVVVAPALAFAHSKSEATTPADGAAVTEVPELSMRFDDPMRIISVSLTSPDGDVEIERETGMDPATEFRALPLEELEPGSYRFDWRGMASDGHPMQGSFSFTVTE